MKNLSNIPTKNKILNINDLSKKSCWNVLERVGTCWSVGMLETKNAHY